MKYLYNYITNSTNLPVNPLVKNSKWFLYRQTHLHLRFSEAANRLGRYKLAAALTNQGIPSSYPAPTSDVTRYNGTHAESLWADTYPFNFDGRNGNAPYYRADWYRSLGVRGRANLGNFPIVGTDSLTQIEDGIIQEVGLENGLKEPAGPIYCVLHYAETIPAFLADKIYAKLLKDGVPDAAATRARLMNKANWYLPFKL